MNKNQWYVLGVGLFFLGWFFLLFTGVCSSTGERLTACYIRRYALSVPGLILVALGMLFSFMGWLEPKKRK